MTRDEAIKIVIERSEGYVCEERMARCLVDTWTVLGMLKLDEPKNLPQRLRDFIMDNRLAQGDAMTRLGQLNDVLKECGLKIVEAK